MSSNHHSAYNTLCGTPRKVYEGAFDMGVRGALGFKNKAECSLKMVYVTPRKVYEGPWGVRVGPCVLKTVCVTLRKVDKGP